ncbi:glycosyltransferase family 2 protein [Butyrivibrio proteoclasticus]|nr:glycosyltransferase family 2 protein [Butyrivibrio proteoclasticus]
MNYSNEKPLLSIIISTFNRCTLLVNNLKRMLECECEDIEFIIGDNGSTDSTWSQLKEIKSCKVCIVHNDKNLGFENFWLLSRNARGKFFLFLNDRDYIDQYGLKSLVKLISTAPNYDFISCEWRLYKKGTYNARDALNIYFSSRHPGMLIYNSSFISKNIDRDYLELLLRNSQNSVANIYIVFQILQNVHIVYVHNNSFIIQPFNREKIPKKRKEYYDVPYVSLEYRNKEFVDWVKYANDMPDQKRSNEILLAMFKDSLMTVTWEFYISMKIPGFAKRNNFENHKYDEWLINGCAFTIHSLHNCFRYKRNIKKEMLILMLKNYYQCLKNLIG